ncbi:MAG: thrombospondin type 3 repeat-containing protein, partial [Thaumarchaeota archaeon]|nr:thrombospondin type 3 repeat-containing protein [Nitrososphaerota archaeon]
MTDLIDNCPKITNPTQSDFDGDKIGDECDIDDDNDGVIDEIDVFDYDPTEWADFDSDGIGDNADIDDDNDNIVDAIDAFDYDPTEWADFDFDGIGANEDTDDDNDGILDVNDPTPTLPAEQLAIEYLEEIQNCSLSDSEKLSTSCYSQLFQKIITEGEFPFQALELSVALSKLGAIDDCHFTAHAMAHASFKENPNIIETLSGLDGSVCRGAFYHGSIASYFNTLKDNGESNPVSYMNLCDSFSGTSNYQDCIHGLGHGFVLFYSNELKPSVQSCNQMSFYQNQICIKGVMMQYTTDQINQYGTTSENISNICTQSELSSQDYQQCVMSIGTTFAFKSFHNFEVASKFCELLEDGEDKEFCIQGLELEIQDSEKYKVSPLTQEIRERFQPQMVTQNSKEWIIDIRSPAIISGFNYDEKTKSKIFTFDRSSYIIMYIPKDLLPNEVVVTVNGITPKDILYDTKS